MSSILLVTQFILAAMVTVAVLLQKSSSIGLGAYSGSNDSMFGAKGPTSFLAKITFTLGFLFVANTIALGYFYNQSRSASIIDSVDHESLLVPSAPVVAPSSASTSANASGNGESVLPGGSTLVPRAPAAPEAADSQTNP